MNTHDARLMALGIAGALFASGCGNIQAPEELTQIQEQAQDARKTLDEATQKAKAAEEAMKQMVERANQTIAQAKVHVANIQKNATLDDQAKKFIQDTLGDSQIAVQQHALPVMQAAWKKVPEQRAWLEQQMRGQIERTTGDARSQWMEALTNLTAP